MMSAQITYRGRTFKTVTVSGITNETDEQILDLAMRRAGESRSSLFGWKVRRPGIGWATVNLHTD